MSKQWGHGYWRGVKAAQQENRGIAGLWFHSKSGNNIKWQGTVIREVNHDVYLVQLFEWAMGQPSEQKLIPFADMREWDFYPTDKAMRRAWNKRTGGSEEDFEWGEKLIEDLR